MQRFDAIIIGSGQAGNPLAAALGKAGWKTALIEHVHFGGTCINDGCTPTKTLIASARTAHVVRTAGRLGINTAPLAIDFHKIIERKRKIVESWSARDKEHLEKAENVTLFFGHARFTAPHSLEVVTDEGRQELEASTILIDTGGRPAPPSFPGAESIRVLNSTTVMELGELPEHLVIVGGGHVALEFGQFFLRLGSSVTLLEKGNEFLHHEDRDIAEAMQKVLEPEGMQIKIATTVTSARPSERGITLDLTNGETIECSHVLYAAGRIPNTDDLGLEHAGIDVNDRGYIRVNDKLETNIEGIYALGDVNGGPAFTHISYDDYRIVRDNLLHGANRTTTGRLVPYVVFTDPQLGRIGITESEARAKGIKHRIVSLPMSHVARAIEVDEQQGLMKAVIGEDDRILGAAVLGIEGGEIMSMIELAMMSGMKASQMNEAIFAHPTLAESLNNLFR